MAPIKNADATRWRRIDKHVAFCVQLRFPLFSVPFSLCFTRDATSRWNIRVLSLFPAVTASTTVVVKKKEKEKRKEKIWFPPDSVRNEKRKETRRAREKHGIGRIGTLKKLLGERKGGGSGERWKSRTKEGRGEGVETRR